jgi:hypothetical protein
MAILFDHNHPIIGKKRNDGGGPGMTDNFQLGRLPIGQGQPLLGETNNFTLVEVPYLGDRPSWYPATKKEYEKSFYFRRLYKELEKKYAFMRLTSLNPKIFLFEKNTLSLDNWHI